MLDIFVRIRDPMIDGIESEGSDLCFNKAGSFLNNATRYTKALHDNKFVRKLVQNRGYTLSECRYDLETLINYIGENVDNWDSYFYQINFKSPEFSRCGKKGTILN